MPTNSLLQSLSHHLELVPVLWPILGLVDNLRKKHYSIPELHKEAYDGVKKVRDYPTPDPTVRNRILVMEGTKKKRARIKPHTHDHITEHFEVVRCDVPKASFLITGHPDTPGELRRMSLCVGMTFTAKPGDPHGLEVDYGTVIVKVIVHNFKTGDIHILEKP